MLLTLITKFDLETMQLDVVKNFVHGDLDEIMFMRILPEYGKNGKVLYLNKTLYGL